MRRPFNTYKVELAIQEVNPKWFIEKDVVDSSGNFVRSKTAEELLTEEAPLDDLLIIRAHARIGDQNKTIDVGPDNFSKRDELIRSAIRSISDAVSAKILLVEDET